MFENDAEQSDEFNDTPQGQVWGVRRKIQRFFRYFDHLGVNNFFVFES